SFPQFLLSGRIGIVPARSTVSAGRDAARRGRATSRFPRDTRGSGGALGGNAREARRAGRVLLETRRRDTRRPRSRKPRRGGIRKPGATPRGRDPADTKAPSPDERASPPRRPGLALSGLSTDSDPSWSRGCAPGSRITPLRG